MKLSETTLQTCKWTPLLMQQAVSLESTLELMQLFTKKAGPSLLEARKVIGYIQPGTAAITPAFDLDAEYVIHAATPTWIDGNQGELQLLRQAYDMCLDLADKNSCDSIAFPLLASGNHGFPKSKALQVAIGAFSEFLMEHEMQIYLVVFGKDSLKLSEKPVHNVSCYIDENYVESYELENYGERDEIRRRNRYQMRRIAEVFNRNRYSLCLKKIIPSMTLSSQVTNKSKN